MSESLVSLLLFVTVTTVSPGGATALATASGAQFGLRRSLPLIGGVAIGLASLAAAAVRDGFRFGTEEWDALRIRFRDPPAPAAE